MTKLRMVMGLCMVGGLAGALCTGSALAQMAISANDGKAVLVDGQTTVPAHPQPDNVTVFDLRGKKAKIVGEIFVPTSVIGPPQSVAISPDGRLALVTASTKIDPADGTKTVPNDKVSVIDLTHLQAVQTLEAGPGASGVSINPAGTLALVANRSEDTLSVFSIDSGKLSPIGKVFFPEGASPSLPVFTPDGSKVLLTRDGDSRISVLTVDGTKITDTGYAIFAGLRPYAIEMAEKGDVAVVANIGVGGRDNDSISLIDVQSNPLHVVYTATVPPSPEGLALSSDGKFVAVSSINGTNFPSGAPGFRKNGVVTVFARDGFSLRKVAETKSGRWCEGLIWSADHRQLYLQCMADNEIEIFSFNGRALTQTGALPINGPAGFRMAYRTTIPGLVAARDETPSAAPVKAKKSKAKKPTKKARRKR